ncbi:MAG: hemerythrin domain-containing protein [Caldimonas sp.]
MTAARTSPDSPLDVLRAPERETEAMKGDWLKMIEAHHAMLERAFDELIDGGADPERRPLLYKRLCYLLTAHSVAEENAVYPALAMFGLQSESDRLYLDQAHAKVMNAMLDMADDKLGEAWLERARELRAAVLAHAKQDEEGDLYPRLVSALDLPTASKLSIAYRREFLAVKPT